MTRTVLALLTLVAGSAAAQLTPPQVMYGHPIPSGKNPPTLPLHQPVRLPTTGAPQQHRNITYLPAPLPFYYYGNGYNSYSNGAQSQPNVEVNVTNVMQPAPTLQLQIPAFYGLAPGQALGNGMRVWDPDADIAAERKAAAAMSDFDPDRADRRAADAEDVKTPESIVNALYDVLSGPRGTPRNWDRFRGLFADGAHLIATRTDGDAHARPAVMTTDEYATAAAPVLERGVFQKEVARSIEKFGNIAHVFSTYECRRTSSDPKPYQRGINSIQLMNDGTRWWITAVSWDAERADNPIPAKYLPVEKR